MKFRTKRLFLSFDWTYGVEFRAGKGDKYITVDLPYTLIVWRHA